MSFDSLGVFGGQDWGRTNFPLCQECITINATHPYYPRSVHPHFQGLCVVFGLLFYIPSARLTEQLAFPPLMALRVCGE